VNEPYGLAFDPAGNLFEADFGSGNIYKFAPDGTRSELAAGTLVAPGGVAVDRDGAIYVTNKSIFSGNGEVVRANP